MRRTWTDPMVILNTKKHSIDFIYSLVAIDLKGYFGVSLPNVMVGEVGADPTVPLGKGVTDPRVCRFAILR